MVASADCAPRCLLEKVEVCNLDATTPAQDDAMQYSPLDPEYLRKLEASVLAHSAEHYRAALLVLSEDPLRHSHPIIEYLEACLVMVEEEMTRREMKSRGRPEQAEQLQPRQR